MNKIITNDYFNRKYFVGILFLYPISTLGDIRNLIIWGVPGLLAYVLFVFLESDKKVALMLKKCDEIKFARVLFNSILFSFIIYVFMAKVYGNAGSTANMLELAAKDYGESLYHILIGMFNLFGNSYPAKVFSGDGFFKFVNFFIAIIVTVVVPVTAVKNYNNMNLKFSKFLILFSLVSSLFYLLAVFLTGAAIYLDRYLIPVYNNLIILFAVTGSYFLEKIKSYKIAKIGISCVLLYVLVSNVFYLYSQKESLLYHKFGYFASGVEGLTDFLENKGLQYGYATFTNAEEYSVLSNNRVRIRSVVFDQETVSPVKWLTSDTFYEPDIYIGNTFLMITEDELKKGFPNGINVWGQPKETFKYKKFNIFVYNYNVSKKFSKAKNGLWLIRGAKSAVYVVDE